jgi:hypothetical protein
MEALPRANDIFSSDAAPKRDGPLVYDVPPPAAPASPFDDDEADANNPWGEDDGGAVWAMQEFVEQYTSQFRSCEKNGLVSGGAAKGVMSASGLPVAQLRKIWELSDIDKDGSLDQQEFVIAMFLMDSAKKGTALPTRLDDDMIPPGKHR